VLAAALLAYGVSIFGCGPPPQSAPRPEPGVLHAPSEYPGAFLDRQTIVATYGKKSAKFDAVLQKRDDELVLLGMTPFGSRAFSLKQTGLQVAFESFVPQELPFPPQYILFDVQRVFFEGTLPGLPTPSDGAHEFAPRDGEVMTEYWQDGRVLQRRFRRTSGDPAGEIVIVYESGMALGGPPPQHIAFTNGWYGYRLDITTLSHQALAGGPTTP
jgi:hypothetical protein